jgi:GT2 family glycosyltransferase
MFPLINSLVVKKGALPNKDFFFSFEDLDFCLKVLDLNFKIVVPSAIMIESRKSKDRWDLKINKLKALNEVKGTNLWREYYSIRNMTYLFSYTRHDSAVLIRYFIKYLLKIILSYSKGMKFGWQTTYYTVLGYTHGIMGKLGRTVVPVSKYK